MPFIPVAIAAVASTVGGALATGFASIGLGGLGAALNAGVAGVAGAISGAGIGGIISIGTALYGLFVGQPKSLGEQINMKTNPSAPLQVAFGRTAVGGNLVYKATFGKNNKYLSMVSVLSTGGPIDSIEYALLSNFRANTVRDPVTQLTPVDQVQLMNSSGAWVDNTSGSKMYLNNNVFLAYKYGLQPETPFDAGILGTLPNFTSNSKPSGLAAAQMVCKYNPTGGYLPNGGAPNAVYVGKYTKLYDPRFDSTQPGGSGSQRFDDYTTFVWSENPAIAALNWCLGRYQLNTAGTVSSRIWGIGAKFSEIDLPSFVDWANVCDANNWKIGGAVSTGDDKFQVLTTICQAGSARPINIAGILSVAYDTPRTAIWSIAEEDVIGTVSIQNTQSFRDRKNRALGQYRDETQFWNMVSTPLVENSTFLTEDGGEARTIQTSYPMVQNAVQCAQLLTYDLCNSREALTVTAECTPRLLNAKVNDCLTITLSDLGLNSQKMLVFGRTFDDTSKKVTLTLVSETDAKHAYSLGQSPTPPAPAQLNNGYDPSNPPAPDASAWAITGTEIISNGLQVPAMVVNGFVDDPIAQQVVSQYRKFGDTAWTQWKTAPAPDADANGVANANAMSFAITGVVAGDQYEVGICYVSPRGVVSNALVLGPETAGDQVVQFVAGAGTLLYNNSVSWTGGTSNGVTGIPGGLATNSNGMLYANNVVYTPIGGGPTISVANALANTTANVAIVSNGIANALAAAANAAATAATALAAGLAANSNAVTALNGIFTLNANVSTIQNTITVLTANIAGANATITALQVAQAANNLTFAGEITSVNANVVGANATITSEIAARISNNTVLTGLITTLQANVVGANSTILSDRIAQASNNSTFASEISVLQSNVVGANATITALSSTVAANNAAQAGQIAILQANANNAAASITNLQTALASNVASIATTTTNLSASITNTTLTAAGFFPSDFSQGNLYWTVDGAGAPSAVLPDLTSVAGTFQVVSGVGWTYRVTGYNIGYASAAVVRNVGAKAVVPGRTYQVTGLVRTYANATVGTPSVQVGLQGLDSSYASLGPETMTAANGYNYIQSISAAAGWVTLCGQWTCPSSSPPAFVRPKAQTDQGTSADATFEIASLIFEDVTQAMAGYNANAQVQTVQTALTNANAAMAGLSTTVSANYSALKNLAQPNPNLCPYSNFESGEYDWSGWQSGAIVYADPNYGWLAYSGLYSGNFYIGTSNYIPMQAGQTYTISGNGGCAGSATGWALGVNFYNSSHTYLSGTGYPAQTAYLSGNGPDYTQTFIAPSTTAYGLVYFGFYGSSNVGGYIQRIKLEVGSVATAYDATASVVTTTSALATATGQLYASYGIEAGTGGAATGFNIYSSSGGTTTSSFIVNANNFQIYNSTAGSQALFSVSGGTNNLANVAINGSLLVTGSVTASALNVGTLSAISSNIGVVTAGTIQSGTSGARTVITPALIQVYDANNVVRVKMGIF